MRRALILLMVAALGVAAGGFAVYLIVRPAQDEQELAEITAATAQVYPRAGRLSGVRFATDHGESWASALARVGPCCRMRIFYRQVRGTWREIGGSAGCLFAAELGMPGDVGRKLGTCPYR